MAFRLYARRMLLDVLVDRVRRQGPMPFEVFMEACLYDPEGGFFATGPLRSVKAGDFLTSPEVSPWFGRTIARYVAARHETLGLVEPTLVEVAAGSGSLLRSLLPALEASGAAPATTWAVEASPAARAALGEVPGVDAVVATMDEAPNPVTGTVIANELLDNLPVALAVRSGGGWEERWVGVDGDGLGLVAAPVRPEVADWADQFGGRVVEGGMVEVEIAASRWVADTVGRLSRGSVLLFDYGGTAEELEPRRTQGTLRTYRSHHLGPDPLLEPGQTDVTVDVNFTAMAAAAEGAGASRVRVVRQDDFLAGWGLEDVISGMRHQELALAAEGPDAAMRRLVVRSEKSDAETLLHPRGLGDFRVLVVEVD